MTSEPAIPRSPISNSSRLTPSRSIGHSSRPWRIRLNRNALIRTLVQLGKTLGLETLAEGIEESEQYSQLEREQCDSGQGFLYARPLDVCAVETFLDNQSASRDSATEAHAVGNT